jgi:hypothetical protein
VSKQGGACKKVSASKGFKQGRTSKGMRAGGESMQGVAHKGCVEEGVHNGGRTSGSVDGGRVGTGPIDPGLPQRKGFKFPLPTKIE